MRRQTSRRDFMKNVTVASVGAYVGHGLAFPKQVRSANEETNVAGACMWSGVLIVAMSIFLPCLASSSR